MMERLTDEYGICGSCEGIAYCRSDCRNKQIYDRLAYYEDLEEQGRLIILPCKVGDTVWVANRHISKPYRLMYPTAIAILSDAADGYVFGATREEAEQALGGADHA